MGDKLRGAQRKRQLGPVVNQSKTRECKCAPLRCLSPIFDKPPLPAAVRFIDIQTSYPPLQLCSSAVIRSLFYVGLTLGTPTRSRGNILPGPVHFACCRLSRFPSITTHDPDFLSGRTGGLCLSHDPASPQSDSPPNDDGCPPGPHRMTHRYL